MTHTRNSNFSLNAAKSLESMNLDLNNLEVPSNRLNIIPPMEIDHHLYTSNMGSDLDNFMSVSLPQINDDEVGLIRKLNMNN